ncbi:carbohydrate ABC transporter permease [Microbacterium murale]|uniref:ABC transporter permease n=1 Tax=Microbacterium murale TaxID=1081040 RepID=A0ABQ1S0W4_9MICO|nr:sugar ABC transporter permease [Microbacterium murale]GGD89110.1 ABC transporter permease [Microbacterium murale]
MHWLSKRSTFGWLVIPAAVVYIVFVLYPVGYSVVISLMNYQGFGQPTFAGLENYHALLADDLFWVALRNTGIILVAAIFVLIPCSFLLALLLAGGVRGGGTARALVFAPHIIAPILVGLVWVFMLDPKLGVLNQILRRLGIENPPSWIGSAEWSPISSAVVFMWTAIGFLVTIFYAGIRSLPAELLEASQMDGASRPRQVWHIVIPLMRSTFMICIVLAITGALRVFEIVYSMTGGGPVHMSEVLVSYMYYTAFTQQQYGAGMAMAVVIAIIGAVGSLGYLALARGKERTQ